MPSSTGSLPVLLDALAAGARVRASRAAAESELLWPARLEYAGQLIGSAWVELRRVR
ncbi:MAG TPA: hypothetical protein VNR66_05175 [Solirubrobacteraceae bacterium]|nr:hypothetical protein [Solirubrobacteraceae bacterium]